MKTPTEKAMRDSEVPTADTIKELSAYIKGLVQRPHDYGTCVYAMSMSAVAAFNYTARKLGVTGFQASCADLDIIKRTRRMDCPFMLIKAEDALYPQYDLQGKLEEALAGWKDWLGEKAAKKLREKRTPSPDVMRHWIMLATTAGKNGFDESELLAKADFLENEFTEDFIETHQSEFIRFGILDVHLFRGVGAVSKAQSCKEGAGWRFNMPTSLSFSRKIGRVKVGWFVETEVEGSNGSSALQFDFPKLEKLLNEARNPSVKKSLKTYIAKARKANSRSGVSA